MAKQEIDTTQSILIIEEMINKAKNRFSENGFLYLLWGWVVFICGTGQFIMMQLKVKQHYLIWLLTWVAVIIQFIYLAKKKNSQRVVTYTDDIIKYVWLSFVMMGVIFGFLIGKRLAPEQFFFYNLSFLVLYGMPTFLSGIILKFKPLVMGGIGCWLIAIAAAFIPETYHSLLFAAAVVIAWIIPGYLLRSKYKKENA